MHSQRELICEGNPFTWLAQRNVGGGRSSNRSVMSQIGRGIGMAFNNPVTRAASELQKAVIPGAGKTREKLKGAVKRIIGSSSYRIRRYGKFGQRYAEQKTKDPKKYALPRVSNYRQKNYRRVNGVTRLARGVIGNEDHKISKVKINNKTSTKFGLVDNQGNLIAVFYPFAPRDTQNIVNNDIGFALWDSATNKFERFNQRLGETPFANEPNFVAL